MHFDNSLLFSLHDSRLIRLLSGTSLTRRDWSSISHLAPILSGSVLLLVGKPESTGVAKNNSEHTIVIVSSALSPTGSMQCSTVVALVAVLLLHLTLLLGLVNFLRSPRSNDSLVSRGRG